MSGGGSYSAVYVPPPLCLFPVVLIMYIPPFYFLSCFVCLFLLSPNPLFLLFLPLCVFFPHLDENFWGVCAYASYAAMYEFRNMHA